MTNPDMQPVDLDQPVEGVVQTATPEDQPALDVDADDSGDDDAQDDGPLAKQAAKWRKKAREMEAELAAATETITTLRRDRAEALADEYGLKPGALWATTDLDSLLGEAGTVDPEKVKAAVDAAVEALNVKLAPKPTGGLHIPQEGRTTAVPLETGGKSRWDSAFRPGYHRSG